MGAPVTELRDAVGALADRVREASSLHVVSHIDADGISAGAIAFRAGRRLGIRPEIDFIKQLDDFVIERLAKEVDEGTLVWFTDLGSGQLDRLKGIDCMVTDHHVPALKAPEGRLKDGGRYLQANPHLHGIDGSQHVSGAGMSYLVGRHLDEGNLDLSVLAIVGAVGDLQHAREGRLVGVNAEIVEEARGGGLVEVAMDLAFFGRETRPVHKLLQYSTPAIPGVTGSELGAMEVMKDADVEPKKGEHWRTWSELELDERRRVISRLGEILLVQGHGHKAVQRLVQEVYTFPMEEPGNETRDAMEFSTLLNACGRYGMARVGMEVCLGDRLEAYHEAKRLQGSHRAKLVAGLRTVQAMGVVTRRAIQFFHARNAIPDTIVGTVASMALQAPEVDLDPERPIIGLALKTDEVGVVKVSGRGTRDLVDEGLDLARAMAEAASAVGGIGGGHNVAAGASIPEGKEEEFLDLLDDIVARQVPRLGETMNNAEGG
jgi:RecJ-like exonuclease